MSASAPLLAEAPTLEAVDFRSRGLDLLLSRVEFARWQEPAEGDSPARIPGKLLLLELGAPLAANIDFLNGYRCRLFVADAYRALSAASVEQAAAAASDAVPVPDGDKLHAVLTWDLLSFMDADVVPVLAAALGHYCTSGTMLHALAFTGTQMPAQPGEARLLPDGRLSYRPSTPAARFNPRYSPVALERMLPGFKLRHSFLLPGGLQDYLFAYE